MTETVFRNFTVPKIPDNIEEDVKTYLNELSISIAEHLDGDRHISGNMFVEGNIISNSGLMGVGTTTPNGTLDVVSPSDFTVQRDNISSTIVKLTGTGGANLHIMGIDNLAHMNCNVTIGKLYGRRIS